MDLWGWHVPWTKPTTASPRQPSPAPNVTSGQRGPRPTQPQGEPVLRRPTGNSNSAPTRGPTANPDPPRWYSPERIGLRKGPSLEEFQLLQSELHQVCEDLARLTEATQNDEASKTHREALHHALTMMDRQINGRSQ